MQPQLYQGTSVMDEEVECRNCHTAGGDDLIAPCACTGSIKYVHRSCLNSWRAVSPNPNSFRACDVCGQEYVFRQRADLQASRVRRFVLYCARDLTGALVAVQAVIGILAVIAWAADRDNLILRHIFPPTWPVVGVYYVWGLFLFSVCAALYGIMLGIYWLCGGRQKKNRSSYVAYDSYPYTWGYYYIWCWDPSGGSVNCCPACDCSCCCNGGHHHHGGGCGGCHCPSGGDCDSGGSGDGMGLAAIVVLVVGIVIGLIVITIIAVFVVRTHVRVLRKYQDAREMEVCDLDGQSPPSPPTHAITSEMMV